MGQKTKPLTTLIIVKDMWVFDSVYFIYSVQWNLEMKALTENWTLPTIIYFSSVGTNLVMNSASCCRGWTEINGRGFHYVPKSMHWAEAEVITTVGIFWFLTCSHATELLLATSLSFSTIEILSVHGWKPCIGANLAWIPWHWEADSDHHSWLQTSMDWSVKCTTGILYKYLIKTTINYSKNIILNPFYFVI